MKVPSLWRRGARALSIAKRRPLRITCRGKEIDRGDLFKYSNGRFLINEDAARARRQVSFDLEQLCELAASIGETSPVVTIDKMEGGFSKALLLRKENGVEMIAKMPFALAGPAKYTTAAEVAVLRYVQRYTNVPVPNVLAWSDDSSNAIGAEYILMDKAPGTQLFNKWGEMAELQQFQLIKSLARLEGELAKLRFPCNGSLYLRESVPNGILLDENADPSQQFCIGRSCERPWQDERNTTGSSSAFDHGPWHDLTSFGIAAVDREIARIKHTAGGGADGAKSTDGNAHGHEDISVLKMAKQVMSLIGPDTLFEKVSRPVLWHTDLHMGNIFVSETDPTQIVSLIDWQSTTISPILLQARFPPFLATRSSNVYNWGMSFPQLPDNFDNMEPNEKDMVMFDHVRAKMAKAYELATGAFNIDGYRALSMPFFTQELFLRSAEASTEGTVLLRECLRKILEQWSDFNFTGPAPFSFDEEALRKLMQDLENHMNYLKIQEIAKDSLDTDSEGWIAPQLDFANKQRENRLMIECAMERSADFNMTPEQVRHIWPFRENLAA